MYRNKIGTVQAWKCGVSAWLVNIIYQWLNYNALMKDTTETREINILLTIVTAKIIYLHK